MIAENADNLIKEVSQKSFDFINQPKEAINSLCKLRAVGPATASGNLNHLKILIL